MHNLTTPQSLAKSIATSYPKDATHVGYPFRKANPSGIEPDPSKKVYCTHWIKTGECNWEAVGCRFKHEIPGKLADLKALGFRVWPKWWKEEQAKITRGPTWMERAAARSGGEEQNKVEPRPIPVHANKAHALFSRISKESNNEMLKYSTGEQSRGVSFDNAGEDLEGLHPVTPAPSRRAPVSSNSSCSSKGYDATSPSTVLSADSVCYTSYSNVAADPAKFYLIDRAASTSSFTIKEKQTVRRPAQNLTDVERHEVQISAQLPAAKDSRVLTRSKSPEPKEPKAISGGGMAKARFAEKAMPSHVAVEAKERSTRKPKFQKRVNVQPGRNDARREKKHCSSVSHESVPTESLI